MGRRGRRSSGRGATEQRARRQRPSSNVEVGHRAAGFGDEEGPGRGVHDAGGPEQDAARKASGGNVGERQRRREGPHIPQVHLDQRRGSARCVGSCRRGTRPRTEVDGRAGIVGSEPLPRWPDAPCATVTLRDGDHARGTIADGRGRYESFFDERDVDGVQGDPGGAIAGPTDGVDEPVVAGGRDHTASLFADHGPAELAGERLPDQLLGAEIGVRDDDAAQLGVDGAGPGRGATQRLRDGVRCRKGFRAEAGRHALRRRGGRRGRWTGKGGRRPGRDVTQDAELLVGHQVDEVAADRRQVRRSARRRVDQPSPVSATTAAHRSVSDPVRRTSRRRSILPT